MVWRGILSYTKRREEIRRYIEIIEGAIKKSKNNTDLTYRITELKQDINNDFFTVLVVGEFKRGKSTFVNALLGEELMITNVIPETATIQAIMYGEEKLAEIVYENGEKERGEANKEFLRRFSPKNLPGEKDIKYVKVSYPCQLLKENVVLVDTPGVQDLDEHRVQVTYDFLPKANAVIMLLDATSPMTRSEKEFIEEHLINNGVGKVLFMLNRIDLLDEDEVDVEEHVELTQKRIREILGEHELFENPIVIPVSAYDALEGLIENNEELIEKSNIREVKRILSETIFGGEIETIKLNSYKYRLENILEKYKLQYEKEKSMLETDCTSLSTQLDNVVSLKESLVQKNRVIEEYVENELRVLLSMIDKSLDKFREDLIEDIDYELDRYMGTEFKKFIERDIPHIIKKRTEAWVTSNEKNIEHFFRKLENKLSHCLSDLFNRRVFLDSEGQTMNVKTELKMQANDVFGATVGAGAVAAVGTIAMTALGFGALGPIITMAVLPSLRNSFLKEELHTSKEKVTPAIHQEINNHIEKMKKVVDSNVYQRVDLLVNSIKTNYNNFLFDYQCHIEQCVLKKQQQENRIQDMIKGLTDNCTVIDKVLIQTRQL